MDFDPYGIMFVNVCCYGRCHGDAAEGVCVLWVNLYECVCIHTLCICAVTFNIFLSILYTQHVLILLLTLLLLAACFGPLLGHLQVMYV
jgi:hypothetical protein